MHSARAFPGSHAADIGQVVGRALGRLWPFGRLVDAFTAERMPRVHNAYFRFPTYMHTDYLNDRLLGIPWISVDGVLVYPYAYAIFFSCAGG